MVADAADGADGVCGIGSLTHAFIDYPHSQPPLAAISMPSVGRISARGAAALRVRGDWRQSAKAALTGKVTCIAKPCGNREPAQCGDPIALRLAFKDLVGSAFVRQHRQHSRH
jgi:hypothetical protein